VPARAAPAELLKLENTIEAENAPSLKTKIVAKAANMLGIGRAAAATRFAGCILEESSAQQFLSI
jgi:glutamate dehydrogenase/leucine dehydrogenase